MLTGRSVSASSFSHSALVCSSWLELLLARSLPFRVRGSWRSPFERERERENVRADCLAPQLLPLRPIYLSIEQTDRLSLASLADFRRLQLSLVRAGPAPAAACLISIDRAPSPLFRLSSLCRSFSFSSRTCFAAFARSSFPSLPSPSKSPPSSRGSKRLTDTRPLYFKTCGGW